jgi:hypothetical protein
MTPPKSQLAFQLKTLFMGSDCTIPDRRATRAILSGRRMLSVARSVNRVNPSLTLYDFSLVSPHHCRGAVHFPFLPPPDAVSVI